MHSMSFRGWWSGDTRHRSRIWSCRSEYSSPSAGVSPLVRGVSRNSSSSRRTFAQMCDLVESWPKHWLRLRSFHSKPERLGCKRVWWSFRARDQPITPGLVGPSLLLRWLWRHERAVNNVMLTFISFDNYQFSNCLLIPVGGFVGGFLWLYCTCEFWVKL